MQSLDEVLPRGHEFYALLGTATGKLVGLLFVAATVAGQRLPRRPTGALRVFLTATVVHFSSLLVASLILLALVENWIVFGELVLACGLIGATYYGFVWRDVRRDCLLARIGLEDRVSYAVLPVVAYLSEAASGIMLASRFAAGWVALAISLAGLLLVGIYNAWDITVWTITRRRE